MNQTELNIAKINLLIDFKNITDSKHMMIINPAIQLKLLGKIQLLWAIGVLDGEDCTALLNMLDNIPSNIKEILDDMF